MSNIYTLQDLMNSHIEDLNRMIEVDLSWKFITEHNLIDEFKISLSQMMIPEVDSVNEFVTFINSNLTIDRVYYKKMNGKSGISLFSDYDCLNILCFEKTEEQPLNNSSGYTGLNMNKIPDTEIISIYPIELYFTKNLSYSFKAHEIHYEKPYPSFSNHSRLYNNTINKIVSKFIQKIYQNPSVNLDVEKRIQSIRRSSEAIGEFYNNIFDLNLESFLLNKDLLLIDTKNLDKELLEAISIHEITKDNYFDIIKEINKIQNLIKDSSKVINNSNLNLNDVNEYYYDFFKNNQ